MTQHITKIVKVGSLSESDRKARGLVDLPDDAEVSIVTDEIVTDPVAAEPKPVELKPGQRRKSLRSEPAESKAEKSK